MGDGEEGTNHIQLNPDSRERPRPGDTDNISTKIVYQPGSKGWAGLFWQFPDGNWGDDPGRKIEGARKVVLWAAGDKGGEVVEFKAGDIRDSRKKYRDSFETSLGRISLTSAWIARATSSDGLTFYLDDVRYE